MDDVRAAASGDLDWSLAWELDGEGCLRGVLRARNISAEPVRLGGKPQLTPLGPDGSPLGASSVITLEARLPGYVDLDPGQSAHSSVGWAGWDGPEPGDRLLVETSDGARAAVHVTGPVRPAATGPATNLWSGWFEPD